jgi:hypothetical protein
MSPLPLWREADPEVFRGTIVAAAERLDVLPLAVEKDYWICQTLHSIVTTHPGEVVFKGGTSLEKLGTSGGSAGSFHRSAYLNPPLEHRGGRTAIADPSAILVELGQ